ncbi:hypothetical protein [Streptomyces sp900116325]|uniref:hypothetical protein n=1 Tax=Streptomyces sp. 900116325 TaxID=3154295 RepID=UPI0033F12D81
MLDPETSFRESELYLGAVCAPAFGFVRTSLFGYRLLTASAVGFEDEVKTTFPASVTTSCVSRFLFWQEQAIS